MLANSDAFRHGRNWIELAADLGFCVGFQIPHVDRRWTAIEPNEDDVLCRRLRRVSEFAGQQLLKSEPQQWNRAHLQEVATANSSTLQFASHRFRSSQFVSVIGNELSRVDEGPNEIVKRSLATFGIAKVTNADLSFLRTGFAAKDP